MEETTTGTQRLYLAFEHAGDGLLRLKVSVLPIAYTETTAFVLIARGNLVDGLSAEYDLMTA
ncbi:hypothetical protein [Sphingomonas sp.]|uniref:hypothetical protein n=1 Tax=Sphingomonas sp. TaxID=28214 RepID=UPI003F6EE5F9